MGEIKGKSWASTHASFVTVFCFTVCDELLALQRHCGDMVCCSWDVLSASVHLDKKRKVCRVKPVLWE